MAKVLAPGIPFVEASLTGPKQKPSLIVLRNSMTPSVEGSALAIAHYWHLNTSVESCHYVIDVSRTYQCVRDQVASLPRTFGPPDSIVINLCGEPEDGILNWDDSSHAAVLFRAARLVAALSIEHKIKIRYLTEMGLYNWHNSWRRRAHSGIYLDVKGGWPRDAFLHDVNYQAALLKKA